MQSWLVSLGASKMTNPAEGKTYPQRGPMTREEFEAYFFGSTTIVGILQPATETRTFSSIEEAQGGRSMEESVAGCYYMYVLVRSQ